MREVYPGIQMKSWILNHIEHGAYAQAAAMAAADMARCRFRHYRRFEDFREWKEQVRGHRADIKK